MRGFYHNSYKSLVCSRKGQAALEIIAGFLFMGLMVLILGSLSTYLFIMQSAVTAVREGARLGALNQDIGGLDVAGGEDEVRQRVSEFMLACCGQNIPEGSVSVTPPSAADPIGERSITVVLQYDMPTPLSLPAVFSSLNTESGTVTLPVLARATMRYEE